MNINCQNETEHQREQKYCHHLPKILPRSVEQSSPVQILFCRERFMNFKHKRNTRITRTVKKTPKQAKTMQKLKTNQKREAHQNHTFIYSKEDNMTKKGSPVQIKKNSPARIRTAVSASKELNDWPLHSAE